MLLTKKISLPVSNIDWPNECACCRHQAGTTITIEPINQYREGTTLVTERRAFRVPYCSRCVTHIKRVKGLISVWFFASLLSLIVYFGVLIGFMNGFTIFAICTAFYFLVVFGVLLWIRRFKARSMITPECHSTMEAVDWNSKGFIFANPEYEKAFRRANPVIY